MRILVIGKNGQLGQSINKLVGIKTQTEHPKRSNKFMFVDKKELDLSSKSSITDYFDENGKFDIVINCAAYTAVDKAEEEVGLANQVNHLAVKQLAEIASRTNFKLIHISTDYVFDGESDKAYSEKDETKPINVYGQTKLDGEKALQEVMATNAIIIRTSWLYSEHGSNFVNTMLKLGKSRDKVSVVSDQIGSPTYAADLAGVILAIINNKNYLEKSQPTAVYHYSNKGKISWYDFAGEIFNMAGMDCKVVPITTREYPTPAKRPKNTVINTDKIMKVFCIKTHHYKDSLKFFIKN